MRRSEHRQVREGYIDVPVPVSYPAHKPAVDVFLGALEERPRTQRVEEEVTAEVDVVDKVSDFLYYVELHGHVVVCEGGYQHVDT